MAKKTEKGKGNKGNLVRREEDQMTRAILEHPVVRKIQTDLSNLQSMLKQLPEAIGRAVNETMKNQAPAGASGPPVPLLPTEGIEIHPDRSVVKGKDFKLDDKPGIPDPPAAPRVHKKK